MLSAPDLAALKLRLLGLGVQLPDGNGGPSNLKVWEKWTSLEHQRFHRGSGLQPSLLSGGYSLAKTHKSNHGLRRLRRYQTECMIWLTFCSVAYRHLSHLLVHCDVSIAIWALPSDLDYLDKGILRALS